MKIGIVGYGSYIPRGRVSVEEIAVAQNADAQAIKSGLKIFEKSVPGKDEDAATMAVEAAKRALSSARRWNHSTGIAPCDLGAIYVGSESHPYAVKPTSTIVGQALGVGRDFFTADLEFACKGGTAALQIGYALAKAGMTKYALAIGSDTAQAEPGDVLEYSAAAGAAAFVVGSEPQLMIATIDETISVTSDTPDFWRRSLQKYPKHTGRFTGVPSYFSHVIESTKKIMDKTGLKPVDFDHVIFHQPNGKFPRIAAKKLGFSGEQIETGLLVENIGNTYSANTMLGLCAVLDVAKPGQKILMTSYGSGSGCDSFVLTVGKRVLR